MSLWVSTHVRMRVVAFITLPFGEGTLKIQMLVLLLSSVQLNYTYLENQSKLRIRVSVRKRHCQRSFGRWDGCLLLSAPVESHHIGAIIRSSRRAVQRAGDGWPA